VPIQHFLWNATKGNTTGLTKECKRLPVHALGWLLTRMYMSIKFMGACQLRSSPLVAPQPFGPACSGSYDIGTKSTYPWQCPPVQSAVSNFVTCSSTTPHHCCQLFTRVLPGRLPEAGHSLCLHKSRPSSWTLLIMLSVTRVTTSYMAARLLCARARLFWAVLISNAG